MFVTDKLETISFNNKNKPKMKKLLSIDTIARTILIAGVAIGVIVTYYIYFGNK